MQAIDEQVFANILKANCFG